jgi:CheY-like chemotaxis protein
VLLAFTVADTGMGIAPGDQEKIFAPFTQADPALTRNFGGSGLGLSISSSLVQLMGGRISVESQPGRGSTFSFTARLTIAPPSASGAETAAAGTERHALLPAGAPPAPARALRILLVEDNPANRKVAVCILNKLGHGVEVAADGCEALERIGRADFDVVLMDVEMPTMDGLQATAAIRALPEPAKARLPIIAMTAHTMQGDRERFLAAGMDGCVTKPISLRALYETLDRLGA